MFINSLTCFLSIPGSLWIPRSASFYCPRLTEKATAELRMGHALCRPTPLFKPLALDVSQHALMQASSWELLDYLSRTGWVLRRKPRGRLPPYMPGTEKLWFASGVTLERSYSYI
eukprot:6478771-Amphidinium_carterae.2